MSLPRSLATAVVPLVLAVTTAACTPTGAQPTAASPSAATTPLTVGLGYIPSVQFAPFYLAEREGWYREAGLAVTFQNKIDPDLVTLVGQGAVDIGLADGTSVIPAVAQGIPIRYVASIYRSFPSVVFAKASAGIDDAADLAGKQIGIPGRYGSSWIMLQALLQSADLTPEDVVITEYPDFGQGIAVQQDAVDAATGFVNNEPIQLELSGAEATVLAVDEIVPLPGPGLITGTRALETKREAVRAFVGATIRAMDAIAAEPQRGLDAAIAAVPDLAQNREAQAAILEATIEAWRGRDAGQPFGTIERGDWEASIAFLTELDLVPAPITPDQAIDPSLLPAG